MKVVLLTTRPSLRPAWLLEVTELLGIADRPDVEVSIVSARRPQRPLPVTKHVLAGPALSFAGRATSVPVSAPVYAPLEVLVANTQPEVIDGPPVHAALSPLEAVEVALGDNPGTDTVGGRTTFPALGDPTQPAPTASLLHLPVYHPRRAVKAVRWRVNKVRITVKRHPRIARLRSSATLRAVRTNLAPSSLPTSFATSCLRAQKIGALVDGADLVVALDVNTHRAAWLLARRHHRPAVVVGAAAGRQVIASRSAS